MVKVRVGVQVKVQMLPHVEGACTKVPGLLLGQWVLGRAFFIRDRLDGLGRDLWIKFVSLRSVLAA